MEVIPGLWMIEGLGPCYLYRDADTYTLIDTGITGDATRILDQLEEAGGKPGQLKQIILTHSHPDHTGSHAELIERTEAQVLAHEMDVPVIIGEAETEIPKVIPNAERKLMEMAIEETPIAKPARVDRALRDGDEIELGAGAVAVHVPGHTPGSLAIFLPKRNCSSLATQPNATRRRTWSWECSTSTKHRRSNRSANSLRSTSRSPVSATVNRSIRTPRWRSAGLRRSSRTTSRPLRNSSVIHSMREKFDGIGDNLALVSAPTRRLASSKPPTPSRNSWGSEDRAATAHAPLRRCSIASEALGWRTADCPR